MADLATAARPYARAVFEMAQESNQFDDWSKRLGFWSAVSGSPEMRERLDSPGLTADDKAELLVKVSEDLDQPGRNFLKLLADNNRLALMPDVATLYEEMRQDAEGKVEAKVISAFPLTDEQRDKIIAALSRRLDRTVTVDNVVDRELVGGAIIRVGDLVIDGTVKGRLEDMQRSVAG